MWLSSFPAPLLKKLSCPCCVFLALSLEINWPCMYRFISCLSVLSHWSMCLFLCQYHTILTTVLLVLAAQSCLTLCDPMDCSLSGSSVHGILHNTGVGCHSLLQGIFQLCNIVWNQDTWCLQLYPSFTRLLWLFKIFCGSIQLRGLSILVVWKIPLEFW